MKVEELSKTLANFLAIHHCRSLLMLNGSAAAENVFTLCHKNQNRTNKVPTEGTKTKTLCSYVNSLIP
jgi:hypothetical protein